MIRRLALTLGCALAVCWPVAAQSLRFVSPAPGAALRPGQQIEVRWTGQPAGTREMELLLSLDDGRSFAVRVTRELDGDDDSFAWTVPGLPTEHARLALRFDAGAGETIAGASEPFSIAGSMETPRSNLDPPHGAAWTLLRRGGELWAVEGAAPAERSGPEPQGGLVPVDPPLQLAPGAPGVVLDGRRSPSCDCAAVASVASGTVVRTPAVAPAPPPTLDRSPLIAPLRN